MYFGYIKDCNDIANKPKAFVRVSTNGTSTIKEDLLASAKSSFSVLEIPSNINNGDIFSVYDNKGVLWYTGKITSYGNNNITCTQIQSILSGLWLCSNPSGTTIETQLKQIVDGLLSGKIGDLTDNLIKNKYKDFTCEVGSATSVTLPTFEKNKTQEFESFIYQMYEEYGILFDISIPYEGHCKIKIFKPNYSNQQIADNVHAITQVSPTLELEQYNKLVIFSKGTDETPSTYRATYVVSDELIPRIVHLDVEEPLVRFVETNTKIVFSDDELDTIVASNLNANMYNHKLDFEMLINNKLYDWKQLKLGQELEIWNGTKYYKTVLTGYELQLPSQSEPNSVKMICGKVRIALTDKLLRKGV